MPPPLPIYEGGTPYIGGKPYKGGTSLYTPPSLTLSLIFQKYFKIYQIFNFCIICVFLECHHV